MRFETWPWGRSPVICAALAIGVFFGNVAAVLAQTAPAKPAGSAEKAKPAPRAEPEQKEDVLPSSKRWQEMAGDWMVECVEGADGRKACVLSQSLSNAKTKQVLASWSVAKNSTGKMMSTLRAPTGVQLAAGTQVTVEGQKPFNAAFVTCINVGCLATFELTPALVGQIGKAEKVTVGVQDLNKRTINFQFSTRGFTKAHEVFMQQTAK